MSASIGCACDPSEADKNHRFISLFYGRYDRFHALFLIRRDHRISVGGDGAWEVHFQIAVIGLDINDQSLVLGQPLAEGLRADELRSSDIPGCVVSVENEEADEGGDYNYRSADKQKLVFHGGCSPREG